jgi:hypothetical protein
VCAYVYGALDFAQVGAGGCREARREAVLGEESIPNGCEGGLRGIRAGIVGTGFGGWVRRDFDLVVADDLVGDFATVRGSQRREVFDL